MTRKQLLTAFPNASEEFLAANASDGQKTPARPISAPKKAMLERPSLEQLEGQYLTAPAAIRFTIPLAPMGKPRMTQRDKWAKRPAVVRWHEWKDQARPFIPENLPANPHTVSWTAYFPFPKSYSQKKRQALAGQFHREKPDRDNIDKLICDFLFQQDKGICDGRIRKFWDDGKGPRIDISVT